MSYATGDRARLRGEGITHRIERADDALVVSYCNIHQPPAYWTRITSATPCADCERLHEQARKNLPQPVPAAETGQDG